MDLDEKVALVKEVGEEILTEGELRELFLKKNHPVAYDGFEPSGNMHIAQGVLRTINVNKMTKAGVKFKILVADWFAWMNNKMGGDLEKIRITGEYFIEIWKVLGMDLKNVEFVWSKDVVKDERHWKTTIEIARNSTVNRIIRCSQIMGRHENENLSAAQIIYPCMQAADIFHLKADITQLGMDQRKVNVLAREIGPKLGFWKPVVVSHHMLLGLLPPKTDAKDASERLLDLKMSKSKPDSAIFMTDTEEDITRKISKAYCPEKQVEENPIIEYARYLVFEKFGKLSIVRPEKFGGNLEVKNYAELEKLYSEGKIHPMDLKASVSKA
ncbi:MAG: tyrosine--tRNA ligase, partial [Candidatus Aenigmarchaeota archaeon]|nr:tyrosine--tRNA ligase [Candidatus Aenigmarchaeota archaeon]